MFRLIPLAVALAALAGCGQRYSPDAYATRAVQQVNAVQQGVIVGARAITIQLDGTTGAASGAAAGGVIGAQTPAGNMASAIGAVGGALVGGLLGTGAERVAGDTTATEYIVRKRDGELLSVTQRDETPLTIGARVLVIGGAQARIVPDYTKEGEELDPAQAAAAAATPRPGAQPTAGQPTAGHPGAVPPGASVAAGGEAASAAPTATEPAQAAQPPAAQPMSFDTAPAAAPGAPADQLSL